MPATRGLSPADLDQIRDHLTAGRKPKVAFTAAAGQMAGKVGQVIELTDPKASDEWIVVRFGRDELPFSPTDLALPARGRRTEPAAAPAPPLKLTQPPAPPKPPKEPVVKEPAAKEPERSEAPKKVAKPKPPASLTVTLAYTDREWTVAAQLGSRTLAKPYAIKPTEALRLVALIDVPSVHEAVAAIIEAERAEAETRAVRLREELAEIESRLAELTSRS
jgi:hypothetical protein